MGILYMSGYADNANAHCGTLEGAFFEKPVVPGAFLRGLREVLAKAG